MRNPGETSKPRAESETTSEARTKDSERDDCSSPPCKRLKQGVLPFSRSSSPPSTSSCSSKSSVPPLSNGTDSINSESKPSCEEKPKVNGGLVTGAPSPPDVKENTGKPQISPDPAKVSKSLILENCVETSSAEKDATASSISSPEANSSCVENELMMIDQSPPAKANSQNKVNGETPLLKSAEKQKRKEEREKERQEKQRLREEKLKEKQEAKAMKEKERLEAKRKREEEKQEKQAEKERREKERMEKREKEEKERLEKKEKKDEEKRKRDEERNARIEEKRKREAEKRSVEEEQERKRQKIQESFANFFNKPSPSTPKVVQTENNSRFKSFQIKVGMSLAPVIRRQLSLDIKKVLDEGLSCQKVSELYLKELENRKPILRCTKRKLSTIAENTESKMPEEIINVDENSNSSIEIIEPKKKVSTTVGLKCKLLQFHKNYRPAYFGTWRRTSKKISPKNPFKKDMELLDYEVDSDDEWEEEEPGESLSNSEGEDEADGAEDDNEPDDDGFFVPHGYLSDDEGVKDEEMEDGGGENEEKGTNSENKKDQQLAKAKAWEAEMKRKCKPMKPVTVGCLWLEDALLNLTLKRFAACLLVDGPIDIDSSSISSKNSEVPVDSTNTMNNGALYVPDEAMPDLIKLIHGNTAGLNKLISQFRKQWTSKCLGRDLTDEEVNDKSPISKRQLEKKIQNIATKERRTDRLRWYVHSHVLASFGLENIVVADGLNISDASADVKIPMAPYTTCNTPSIMQFTRPVSPALHRITSPEQTQQTSKFKPAGALHNSPSPMEVDSTSASLNVTHCQPAQVSGFSSGENSKLCVKNNLNNSQIGKLSKLFTAVASTSKTETVTSQELSSGNCKETVCID